AEIGIGGGHAVISNADCIRMIGCAFGQDHASARRCFQNSGQGSRMHVSVVLVSAQDQVGVGYLLGAQRRIEQARASLHGGQARIDVEHNVVKLDDEAAVA